MKKTLVRIYLDNAAATPLDEGVARAMQPYWYEQYGNPSGLHAEGRATREAVEVSRQSLAKALNCKPDEVVFTSGGTEANALGIFGVVDTADAAGKHLITSAIEHPSVLDCFRKLEACGARVDYVGVDAAGILDLAALQRALTADIALVSIMFVNNEIGTLQPLGDVVKLVRKHAPAAVIHTDACQAPLFFKLDTKKLAVDLVSLDAQKMYGPKGVGALYKKQTLTLQPRFYGGKQEHGLRPGTENVPGIVGFAQSYELAETRRAGEVERLTELRDYFIAEIQAHFPNSTINGSLTERMPNNVNVSFEGAEGEFLVLQLDKRGIACAARSACFGAGGEGSPVVAAIDQARSGSAVRFSMGRQTSKEQINHVIAALREILGSV